MSKTAILPKSAAILITLALLLALSYPAFAQTATSTGTTRKEKIQDRVETRKENVADRVTAMKERVATKEAALKARLEAFKDRRKAEVVDRLNKNLNNINKKMTEQMLKHLGRMTSILTKLEARVNSAKPDIKDVTAAKEAIADARAAIDSATEVVKAQAEKDYTITVTSEGKARTDVKKVRDVLHADLKAVRETVVKAKQAVANAIRVAKSGKVEIPKKEGTPSGRE